MGWPFGLSVTYDAPLYIFDHGEIYEETDGTRTTLNDYCVYDGCVIGNVQPLPSRDYAHPPTRTFEVVLYTDRNVPYGNTTLVVNERRLHFPLRGDFDSLPGDFYVTVPGSLANTTLNTIIYENGREVTSCDVYFSSCQTSVTSGATYYADVEDPDGNVYGITPTYLATSSTTGVEETADDIDLTRLGALFAGTSDVCDALVTFPYGTHLQESSETDQELACEEALANRSSMTALLQAVAAAGTGTTAVLWWLEHQATVQQLSPAWPTTPWPDAQVPAIPDLPQVWQGAVMNLADHYMLQANGNLAQTAAETIAAACLWDASRITNGLEACRTMPVFVTGSDVAEATDHDLEAITAHPEWAMLNYEASRAKNGSRSWYDSVAPCNSDGDAGQQCDEYPFWASEQGGPLAPITPSLRYIDGDDNVLQGSRYGSFVQSCGLRTGTPQEGANAVGGTAFLVVPLPSALGIPSTWLCNRG
ncbi:MAG TPA: hypothetical protein VN635_02705 [Conexibacter sp.]|nr:hypothetical protein [Conexibacter sp.]